MEQYKIAQVLNSNVIFANKTTVFLKLRRSNYVFTAGYY